MNKQGGFFLLMAILLLGCGNSKVISNPNQNLGILELNLNFEGVSTAKFVNSKTEQSRGILQEQDVVFENGITNIIESNDFDYLIATFSVKHAASSRTDFKNLTLYALAKSGNVGGTVIKNITDFGGITNLNEQAKISPLIIPIHGVKAVNGNIELDASHADFQAFTTSELETAKQSAGNFLSAADTVLNYGFSARCKNACTAQSNIIKVGSTGEVTIALRVPMTLNSKYRFTMNFLVLDEQSAKVTRGVYPAERIAGVEARAASAGAKTLTQFGLVQDAHRLTAQNVPVVRTSSLGHAIPTAFNYDFPAGDSLLDKYGWSFADQGWQLETVPNTQILAMPFKYPGVKPGNYGMSEMRFVMPPTDGFWLKFRWYVPANYEHRHDTHLDITEAQRRNWQLGDVVIGTDGVSKGTISGIDTNGVYLRFADKPIYNETWIGQVSNQTRKETATSTLRAQWPANNKLLAVWCDDYSARGEGPTIVWGTDIGERNSDGSYKTDVVVGHSVGGFTGSSSGGYQVSGGTLIAPADAGKYIDLVFHAAFSSGTDTRDGVIQTFVKRQGESKYVRVINKTDADLNKRVNAGQWRAGYLMGWSNSGFDADTNFFISKIEYFDSAPAEIAALNLN